MFEMLTHPLQCRRFALIEWKHCVDSAASLQVLAEEPRGKKMFLCAYRSALLLRSVSFY